MRLTIDRLKFLDAFKIVSSVAPTRSNNPALQNVKLEAGDGGAVLSATDTEIGIRHDLISVSIDIQGKALLPVSRVLSILRESPDKKLVIEVISKGVNISGERSNFSLPMADLGHFVDVDPFSDEDYHEVPAGFLKDIIHRTIFATDNESSRYALSGVLFELNEGDLIAVGTDGRRLAKMQCLSQSIGVHETSKPAIVPKRVMQLIDRALLGEESPVRLSIGGNDIVIKSGSVTICARLVEGRFPKWREVFPRHHDSTQMDLHAGKFYSAVRQAAIVTSEESRGIDCIFGLGKAILSGEAAETGQSRIEMPIEYDGKPITLTLDPKYMSDFLKVLDAEKTFSLEVKDAKSAAICTTDDGYGYVIMPMARQ
tara:strand:- start:2579 stop:3688 length:1110 start_codon:yes stop_codon:yes gene_type:complete